MVHGVVYTTAGARRDVVALDAATGEMLWMHARTKASAERCAAATFRARAGVLERWQRRANYVRDAGLPAGRAGREDRQFRCKASGRTAWSI